MDPEELGARRQGDNTSAVLAVYRLTEGKRWTFATPPMVAEDLGWSIERTERVLAELGRRRILEPMDTGPSYRIAGEAMGSIEADIAEQGPEGSELLAIVEALQLDRTLVLEAIHDMSGGDLEVWVDSTDIIEALGTDRDRVHEALMWLAERGLVEDHGGTLLLAPRGADLVERARSRPDEPAAAGVVAFGDISISRSPGAAITINVGSPGTVTQTITGEVRVEQLRDIIERGRSELPESEERDRALIDLEAAAEAGQPSSARVRQALRGLQRLSRDASASGLGQIIAKFLSDL